MGTLVPTNGSLSTTCKVWAQSFAKTNNQILVPNFNESKKFKKILFILQAELVLKEAQKQYIKKGGNNL